LLRASGEYVLMSRKGKKFHKRDAWGKRHQIDRVSLKKNRGKIWFLSEKGVTPNRGGRSHG